MKSVLSYIDYRRYLRDFYEEKKHTTHFFSTRYFAQKAGLSSPSFLREVITGKKNLGKQSVDKFIRALELTGKEARFFKYLVFFNQGIPTAAKFGSISTIVLWVQIHQQ